MKGPKAISAAAFALLLAGCGTESASHPDSGKADGGTDGGVVTDAGCKASADCSKTETLGAICSAGGCIQLTASKSRLEIKLAMRASAQQIMPKVSAFTYYAVHPLAVSGAPATCGDFIKNKKDPLLGEFNVIQKFRVGGMAGVSDDVISYTLDMPDVQDLVLYIRIHDFNEAVIGVGCEGGIKMPNKGTTGVTICPATNLYACGG